MKNRVIDKFLLRAQHNQSFGLWRGDNQPMAGGDDVVLISLLTDG